MAVLLLRLFACKHQLDHEEAGRTKKVHLKAYSVTNNSWGNNYKKITITKIKKLKKE